MLVNVVSHHSLEATCIVNSMRYHARVTQQLLSSAEATLRLVLDQGVSERWEL